MNGASARNHRWLSQCALPLALSWLGASEMGAATADDRPTSLGKVTVELDCKDKARAPVCTRPCVQKAWEWRFWVTNYNVGGSWGFGEHQGIAIVEVEYEIDPRFGRDDGLVHPSGTSFLAKLTTPQSPAIGDHALCVLPEAPREGATMKLIYNHGRTVAMRGSRSDWDLALDPFMGVTEAMIDIPAGGSHLVGPMSAKEWQDPASAGIRQVADVRACMSRIEDGYCDAVCGNCSYVLPESSIGARVIDPPGQDVQFTAYEGAAHQEIRYVRTDPSKPRPNVPDAWGGSLPDTEGVQGYKDAFTHCLPMDGRQALSMNLLTQAGGNFRFLTGLYGHNSNSDAEAELRAFRQCAVHPTQREFVPVRPCEACGTVRPDRREQWPCLDENNFAASTWDETGLGWHNVDDSTLGNHPSGTNPVPVCRHSGKPVYGM